MSEAFVTPVVVGLVIVVAIALIVLSHFSHPGSRGDRERDEGGDIDDLLEP